MKPIRFLLPAETELREAARYYEMQSPGLGDAFLDKVDSAVAAICAHPRSWPLVRGKVRRRLVYRFPYGLLYREDADEIVVLATMHLHRHPDYWLDRL